LSRARHAPRHARSDPRAISRVRGEPRARHGRGIDAPAQPSRRAHARQSSTPRIALSMLSLPASERIHSRSAVRGLFLPKPYLPAFLVEATPRA
jgi:hypothetical protein